MSLVLMMGTGIFTFAALVPKLVRVNKAKPTSWINLQLYWRIYLDKIHVSQQFCVTFISERPQVYSPCGLWCAENCILSFLSWPNWLNHSLVFLDDGWWQRHLLTEQNCISFQLETISRRRSKNFEKQTFWDNPGAHRQHVFDSLLELIYLFARWRLHLVFMPRILSSWKRNCIILEYAFDYNSKQSW